MNREDSRNDVDDDQRLVIDEKEEEYNSDGELECYEQRSKNGTNSTIGNRFIDKETFRDVEMARMDVSKYEMNHEMTSFNPYKQMSRNAISSNAFSDQKVSLGKTSRNEQYYLTKDNSVERVVAVRPTQLQTRPLPLDSSTLNNPHQVYRTPSTDDEDLAIDTVSQARCPPATAQHPSPLSETIAEETHENFFPSPRHTADYEKSSMREFLGGYKIIDELHNLRSHYMRSFVRNDDSDDRDQFSSFQSDVGQYRSKLGSSGNSSLKEFDMEGSYQRSGTLNDGNIQSRETIMHSPEHPTEKESSSRLEKTTSGRPNSLFSCHLCDHVGQTKAEYTLHMRSIHFRNRCSYCGYSSRTLGRLKRHVTDFHSTVNDSGKEEAKTKSRRRKTYTCRDCPYITDDQNEYWVHLRIHIPEEKQLLCTRCMFVTSCKHHMEYHLRNHVGSKPYKCERCNYQCINKAMLKSHMKSHDNFYPYRCANCTYAAKYLHALNMHLKKTGHVVNTQVNSSDSVVRSAKMNPSIHKPSGYAVIHKSHATKKPVKRDIKMPSLIAIRSNIPENIQTSFAAEVNHQSFNEQSQQSQSLSADKFQGNENSLNDVSSNNSNVSSADGSSRYVCTQWQRSYLDQLSCSQVPTEKMPRLTTQPILVASVNDFLPSSGSYSKKSVQPNSSSTTNSNTSRPRMEYESLPSQNGNALEVKVESLENNEIQQAAMSRIEMSPTIEDDTRLYRWNKKRRLPLSAEVHAKKVNITEKSLEVVQNETSDSVQAKNNLVPLDLSVGKNDVNDERSVGLHDSFVINEALIKMKLNEQLLNATGVTTDDTDKTSVRKNFVPNELSSLSMGHAPLNEIASPSHIPVNEEYPKYRTTVSAVQRDESTEEPGPSYRNVSQLRHEAVEIHNCNKIPFDESKQDHSFHRESPFEKRNISETFECLHCGIIFTDHVLHAFHMSFHSRDAPFRCRKCRFETRNNREFFIHIGRVAHSG